MPSLRKIAVVLLIASTSGTGCRSRLERSQASTDASSKPVPAVAAKTGVNSTVSAKPSAAASALAPRSPSPRRTFQPVGRPHAIEPGMGLGPIMFGASVPTIERHMGMKCEVLTETRCRVITAGVEFELTKGVVSGIQIHRFDRPVEGDAARQWGVFAGGIPPNVLLTMVPEAVIESLGKPKKSVEVKEKNPNNTVRRDTYNGMVLEYDLNPDNQRLMLGGIRIVKKG